MLKGCMHLKAMIHLHCPLVHRGLLHKTETTPARLQPRSLFLPVVRDRLTHTASREGGTTAKDYLENLLQA